MKNVDDMKLGDDLKCENCLFYFTDDYQIGHGECRRHPRRIKKTSDLWCGDYSPNDILIEVAKKQQKQEDEDIKEHIKKNVFEAVMAFKDNLRRDN